MIDWLSIFAFTVFSIFTILSIFYFPAAFIEKKWPFQNKRKKQNSGVKFG
jgi:predicted permease